MTRDEFLKREMEVQEAVKMYPGVEMTEAYRRWKKARGEQITLLNTRDKSLKEVKEEIKKSMVRPCDQKGCDGIQLLESVCGGCVEGKAGYKTKWICQKCLYRELSKKGYLEWLKESS